MARNPKDLVVSYYQFHRSLRTMSYRGTFQEFCRRFMNDKCKCEACVDVTAHCSSSTGGCCCFAHIPPVLTVTAPVGPASTCRRTSWGWG